MTAVLSRLPDVETAMAAWVTNLAISEVPQPALRVARDCVTDGVGVMLAGSGSTVFSQAAGLPRPAGVCAVVDGMSATDASMAALLNGIACHAMDFDDTSYAGIVHGTAVVLPAVLAAAQETDASGAQLLEAFIAGIEVEYALGLAVTDSFYERGFWSTAALGVVGAAAGVAKLLGLPAAAVADAIRIAANMPIGLRGTHGSTAKPYLCGMAARLGMEAAHAARAGIHGQHGTFERPRGFAQTLNGGILKSAVFQELGSRYTLVNPGVAFKLRPLCSATQAAIEAVTSIMADAVLQPSDIDSVVCYGTALVVASLPYTQPSSVSEAQFSMQFALGCTLLKGDVRLDHLNDITVNDRQLRQLMARIELREDPSLQAPQGPEAARVEIKTRDGRHFEKTVLAATGMPQHPASQKQLSGKFMNCATRRTGASEARSLWECLQHIDQLPEVRNLFSGLSPIKRA